MSNTNKNLLEFIEASPSMFHAINSIKEKLDGAGFLRLKESERWNITAGHYYVLRNNSSIIAFEIPAEIKDYHFQIAASHSDSPVYKVKAQPELDGPSEYLKLNVEAYGSMIDYTWFDKPLSVAGRVFYKEKGGIASRLVSIDKDILCIPSIPIHFNREVNKGYAFNRQVDLCPLFSAGAMKKGAFDEMIAEAAGINASDIVSKDLYLTNRQKGLIWGYKDEFISSPKLDDLQAAYASLEGFISSSNAGTITVYACFDNEEVGSKTQQGAESTFLVDTLKRINDALGNDGQDYHAAIAKSFMVSFDNAHAVHPNHPEKYDAENRCFMNKGLVIKENASQSYTTDAFSRALFRTLCDNCGVPCQSFANRSDSAGGSTLGNISNTQVSVHAVDIGLAQLAMHSAYETAGAEDTGYAVNALKAYYSSMIIIDEADHFEIKLRE